MIIEDTYNLLKSRYKNRLEELSISDVRIGTYLTAVRLSDGSIGASATLTDDQPFCAKSSRDFGDFTPLKIRGQKVMDIFESEKKSNTFFSLKMAVLNAISSKFISSGNYKIIEDKDPIQLVNLDSKKTITVVGAFHSYIRKISETQNKLYVLELNEEALPAEYRKFFIPAGKFKSVIPLSDIVIITGQTLVNSTIDDLLFSISSGSQVIVTGPSSSIIPDILFENKVSIIGAVKITKPEILFDIVSEGGTGFHLFEYCAQKICIIK
ncbi:MAG: hypothetical protein A2X05_14205 [Bacteroidetes bacterium GWE2_41_25]|nr:MAG: hypothetical protein A2X03_11035 [Bacteroidetes bacterium GWA2_40_15]OFX83548.1 MAG: hypothetical protein A2X06_08945 [Bacteroidetes bacterium GWC2_40_22]OFX95477.1 MAG: hypothetical protein A2X05_14205 [Bacteroidetes bacterium GWE2_41_25]OFY57260.1 MAG: hypothetical protein A2X04_16395 [Bacteroidetes bacterium GWF2_41_9]HBH84432.1 hypothetical protein [Bacteroidales bacterium]